ncbi:MAG: spermidine synthase [Rhodospirillaceae bacterium]
MLPIALPVFLGAFLLFAVEPLIAKMILPWFGGSAAVWLACLLFFQGALLAGYFYAHLLSSRLSAGRQWRVHLVLLGLSLLVLPIIPSESWKPAGGGVPLLQILELLAATIGLPFVLLAATGPLMQTWVARRDDAPAAGAVYRLYALSNLASLLALLSYPILVEPWLPTHIQAWIWSVGYMLFASFAAFAAWRYGRGALAPAEAEEAPPPSWADRLFWLVLAAAPSILLLAVTNYMLRNIAAIPLLWVVPLSLYLLSFIVCFDHPRWYYRPLWYALLPVALGGIILTIVKPFLIDDYIQQLAIYAAAFFVCCMICHGELASQKPVSRYLTTFYLIIGCGGGAGGLAIAAAAPVIFNRDRDLTVALMVFVIVVGWVAWDRWPLNLPRWGRWIRVGALLLAPLSWPGLIYILANPGQPYGVDTVLTARNFYGPLEVTSRRMNAAGDVVLEIQNGNIMHGRQYTAQAKRCEPLSYYVRTSGLGVAIGELAKDGPLRIGMIGLGAGTVAGYARPGDRVRFYEINPLVRTIATNVFSYLACAENAAVALGDARLTLEREAPNNFDVLAVDAFTSDAIPIHLLTAEAFDLYWKHIKPGGVLAVHVSNRFIDLAPIVAAAAARSGKIARLIDDEPDEAIGGSSSDRVLVTDNPEFFARAGLWKAGAVGAAGRLWTDDYSNLWQALKR